MLLIMPCNNHTFTLDYTLTLYKRRTFISSLENIACMSGQNASVAGQSGRGNVRGVQNVRGNCPRGEVSKGRNV